VRGGRLRSIWRKRGGWHGRGVGNKEGRRYEWNAVCTAVRSAELDLAEVPGACEAKPEECECAAEWDNEGVRIERVGLV